MGLLARRRIYRGLRVLGRWQRTIDRRFTPLGRVVMAFALGAGVFGVDTRMNLLHQAFSLAVALLLIAWLAARWIERRLRGQFTAQRQLPRYSSQGATLTYGVSIRAQRPERLAGCSVEEPLPDPSPSLQQFLQTNDAADARANPFDRAMGYPRWRRLLRGNRWAERPQARVLGSVEAHGTVRQRLQLTPLRRGYLRLPGLLLSRAEPLGLCRASWLLPAEGALLVLPARYAVAPLQLPGRRQYQPGGMTLASSVGDSREFIGLREYRSGDSPRNIHWPSWARSGKPQVKEYQDEFFTRHALLLDSFTSESPDPRFEAAVSIAASLCESMQQGDSLLDLMFVGAEPYCFTAGRGLAGTEQFLEILACANPCVDQPFARLRQSLEPRLGQLSAVVCILLDFDRPRRELLQGLLAANLPLRVLLVSEQARYAEQVRDWPHQPPRLMRPGHLAEDLARL
jgi:hypothetical protein